MFITHNTSGERSGSRFLQAGLKSLKLLSGATDVHPTHNRPSHITFI